MNSPVVDSKVAWPPGTMHTSFAIPLVDCSSEAALSIDVAACDPQFAFILWHEGVNGNGDCFLKEELRAAYATAVGKKIDMQHDQKFMDVVGCITASEFVDDPAGAHVDCRGEIWVTCLLYTSPGPRD